MIVLDLETSGLYPEKHGIWQIGALDFNHPERTFLDECRIDDEDEATKEALTVTGKTEVQLRDEKKQSQRELLERFFDWLGNAKMRNFVCQNPQFDAGFLTYRARLYGLKYPFHHRAFDMHSFFAYKYFQMHGRFLIKENKSDMGLANILQFCGMKDERVGMKDGKIIQQGKPHNALEDARLTAECFSRLLYGRGLLEEYTRFKIPGYLNHEEKPGAVFK